MWVWEHKRDETLKRLNELQRLAIAAMRKGAGMDRDEVADMATLVADLSEAVLDEPKGTSCEG